MDNCHVLLILQKPVTFTIELVYNITGNKYWTHGKNKDISIHADWPGHFTSSL